MTNYVLESFLIASCSCFLSCPTCDDSRSHAQELNTVWFPLSDLSTFQLSVVDYLVYAPCRPISFGLTSSSSYSVWHISSWIDHPTPIFFWWCCSSSNHRCSYSVVLASLCYCAPYVCMPRLIFACWISNLADHFLLVFISIHVFISIRVFVIFSSSEFL